MNKSFLKATVNLLRKVAFFLLIYNSCLGQKKITGYILNKQDGKPVPFAVITDEKRQWGVNSDENGAFLIENAIGDSLVIGCLGFFENRIIIPKEDNKSIRIYLAEKSTEGEENCVIKQKG